MWPLDPLHWWSRTWEYPFIAHHIPEIKNNLPARPKVLDIGAAVTFFSAYLLNEGFDLTNLDYDAAMPGHFSRVLELLKTGGLLPASSSPGYVVGDARDTKLESESFDMVTCVSVLEHVPQWERTIPEIHRLISRNGYFVLTFDVRRDEQSNGLSMPEVARILDLINSRFDAITQIETQMPAIALTNDNTPMPTPPKPNNPSLELSFSRLWPPTKLPGKAISYIKRKIKPVPPQPENLAIYGGIWRKR